jgi:hypothetical protein
MKPNTCIPILLLSFLACSQTQPANFNFTINSQKNEGEENPYAKISSIPVPEGFSRIVTKQGSFAEWLRALTLKKKKIVLLYNGLPKKNQTAQFAVVNMSVGNKDLQQCADAVMRLRAEYLYSEKRFKEINFWDNNHMVYTLESLTDRRHFDQYLYNVFAKCGTLSLERQLKPVEDVYMVQPGDILIQGGSPGHAMIVVDMATNPSGKKIYLLAQSYMPAQDIHIVVNPVNKNTNPWYELNNNTILTPEWVFEKGHFRSWP